MGTKLLIDATLAILLVVGSTNRSYIGQHKRLQNFDVTDFGILSKLIEQHDGLLFTPNVWSETSNLVRQTAEPRRSELTATIAVLIDQTDEHYVASRLGAKHLEHARLGLTDAVLLQLSSPAITLLTVGLSLYLAAARADLPVINFNHVRERQRPELD